MPHLNIKDDETHRLAGELAKRRHTSSAAAVKLALKETLDREPRQARSQEEIDATVRAIMDIARGGAKHWPSDKSSKELMDALYDDDGLPI